MRRKKSATIETNNADSEIKSAINTKIASGSGEAGDSGTEGDSKSTAIAKTEAKPEGERETESGNKHPSALTDLVFRRAGVGGGSSKSRSRGASGNSGRDCGEDTESVKSKTITESKAKSITTATVKSEIERIERAAKARESGTSPAIETAKACESVTESGKSQARAKAKSETEICIRGEGGAGGIGKGSGKGTGKVLPTSPLRPPAASHNPDTDELEDNGAAKDEEDTGGEEEPEVDEDDTEEDEVQVDSGNVTEDGDEEDEADEEEDEDDESDEEEDEDDENEAQKLARIEAELRKLPWVGSCDDCARWLEWHQFKWYRTASVWDCDDFDSGQCVDCAASQPKGKSKKGKGGGKGKYGRAW